MLNQHQVVSSYLLPKPAPAGPSPFAKASLGLVSTLVPRPHELPRVRAAAVTGALLWAVVLLGSNVVVHAPSLRAHSLASKQSTLLVSESQPQSQAMATALPTGPTGSLLPPGTMAPINTYQNSYSRGQCTWYVAGRRPVPANWGNANSWYTHAIRAGWRVGSTPAVAAIATTSSGWYGHVALVEAVQGDQVLISEMNYLGPFKLDHRWVSARAFRYIY